MVVVRCREMQPSPFCYLESIAFECAELLLYEEFLRQREQGRGKRSMAAAAQGWIGGTLRRT